MEQTDNQATTNPAEPGHKLEMPQGDNLETNIQANILNLEVPNPIWLSVSEAAKIGGVQNKTIRRAIMAKSLKYKIVGNRYLLDLASVVQYLQSNTKLKNKLNLYGLGQYIDTWRD
jgi:excisionase family DNA binding protein